MPYLDRSINSVLNQSFEDFELIIIDDASTDGSSEKIQSFSDPRIKILKRDAPGAGGYAARNLGIRNSKYDWINFLDADDEWDLDLLTEIKKIIDNYDPDIIACGLRIIINNKEIPDKIAQINKNKLIEFSLIDYLRTYQFISTDTITVKKSVIIDAGMFPDNGICKRGGDMDTWIRCLQQSKKNIRLNEPLASYYKDSTNRVSDDKVNMPEIHCPYNVLQEIRSQTKDIDTVNAIDFLCNKLVYGVLMTKVNFGLAIDYNLLKKMKFNRFIILRVLKLYFKRLIFIIKK